MKHRLKKNQKTVKGMPSAVLLSILIHAALFLLAGMLVVFTVVKKEDKKFIPPKAVERPKMNLRKPKVKVKKTSKPKPTTRIVTKLKRTDMPNIQLPEISDMAANFGDALGGFDIMPDLGKASVFGSGQTIGNDFVGTFYDTKQNRSGQTIPYSIEECYEAVRRFLVNGWKPSSLSKYYKSPEKRYTTCFIMPLIPSALIPAFFGEPDIEGTQWITHYKGQLVHKEGITFRFMGWGDGAMAVRVDGKTVLLAGWLVHAGLTVWNSTAEDHLKYRVSNGWWSAGDWITLEPGVPLDMEVVMVESGGLGTFMLAVQEKGVEYEERKVGSGPIFPVFKTAELSRDLLDAIYANLIPGEISLTNGPVFCDYGHGAEKKAEPIASENQESPKAFLPKPEEASALRTWTGVDGTTMEAEYITVIAEKVVLKSANGKQKKIPLAQLSPEDRKYIELSNPPKFNIDFGTKTKQVFSIQDGGPSGISTGYDCQAKVKLKQTTAGDYNYPLRIEFFAIGKEINGDRNTLIDRQESSFTPTKENRKSHEFTGKTIRLNNYIMEFSGGQTQHRGQLPIGYLVTVTDERGEIIQHQESKDWLYENLGNLKQLPPGAYMDKNCTRTFPTPPPAVPLDAVWGGE